MKVKTKKIGMLACTLSLIMMVVCTVPAQSGETKQCGLVKTILKDVGITVDMVPLQRTDGFTRALVIEGPQAIPITIGLQAGSLLIAVGGDEYIAYIHNDGSYEIMQGDGTDLEEIICIISAVINGINAIELCDTELCVVLSVISTIINVTQCLNAS